MESAVLPGGVARRTIVSRHRASSLSMLEALRADEVVDGLNGDVGGWPRRRAKAKGRTGKGLRAAAAELDQGLVDHYAGVRTR